MEQCSIDYFDRCWNKSNPKFRQTLLQKAMNRGIEPTMENCRDHWLGLIKPYTYPKGRVEHLHVDVIRKRRKIYGTPRSMENDNRKKNRRFR